ncbi:MAG: ribonuclease D, partial [Nitrospirae bacterium]
MPLLEPLSDSIKADILRNFKEQLIIVDTPSKWFGVAKELSSQKRIAIDMESNGFYSYPERICLIQIAIENKIFIIDTLSVDNIEALGKIFADPSVEKIFHGCDYDLRSFERDYGFCCKNLFDTEIAAKFCGAIQSGLDAVLKNFMNININKTKKLQRSNWGKRPLTKEMLLYAAKDVCYLIPLSERLKEHLRTLGRLDWVY